MDKIDIRDLIIRTLKENSEEINKVEIVEQTAFLRIAETIVKNLPICVVMQQRELLLDYTKWLNDKLRDDNELNELIDDYLNSL